MDEAQEFVVTLKHITPEQVQIIDFLIGQLCEQGYGSVSIEVVKSEARLITPAPSLNFAKGSAAALLAQLQQR